jgi:uncharacterized membrane protein
MNNFLLALAAFVGTHLLMSHPLRKPMVSALGEKGFQGVYSLISIVTFVWVIFTFRSTTTDAPAFAVNDGIWWVATVSMLIGSILFAGSLIGNPALPQPGADKLAAAPARGVFGITRHPMMWGFAFWAITHALASPTPRVLALTAAMAFLALAGSLGQDKKKAALMGDAWQGWVSRTAFVPFSGQLSGRISWASAWPGRTTLLLGTLLWLGASWAHPLLGQPVAGLWRWL